MKKYIPHLILFLLFFQIEVRVKAIPNSDEKVSATVSPFHFQGGILKYHLGKGSSMVVKGQSELTLITGYVWIEKSSQIKVNTPYGFVQSSKGGFWVFSEKNQYRVRNIDSDAKVVLKDETSYEVPEGFEVWFSGMNADGSSAKGMIEPVNISNHLKYWNQLYLGTKDGFKAEVSELKSRWKGIADTSSDLYVKVVERQLSSVDEQRQRKKQREIQSIQEKNQLKRKFYENTFSK